MLALRVNEASNSKLYLALLEQIQTKIGVKAFQNLTWTYMKEDDSDEQAISIPDYLDFNKNFIRADCSRTKHVPY